MRCVRCVESAFAGDLGKAGAIARIEWWAQSEKHESGNEKKAEARLRLARKRIEEHGCAK
ncbi:MAG TPA: hypothetical protein VHN14_16780 [Kofleriaceae bacterium]|nr:hypothetical protein [Kofleriaceae bacterium]